MEINLKQIGTFLKSMQGADYAYLRQLIGMRESINYVIRDCNLSKEDVCSLFELSAEQYDDFIHGNYDFSLRDIAKIDAVIREHEKKGIDTTSVVKFPDYRYSEMKLWQNEIENLAPPEKCGCLYWAEKEFCDGRCRT